MRAVPIRFNMALRDRAKLIHRELEHRIHCPDRHLLTVAVRETLLCHNRIVNHAIDGIGVVEKELMVMVLVVLLAGCPGLTIHLVISHSSGNSSR